MPRQGFGNQRRHDHRGNLKISPLFATFIEKGLNRRSTGLWGLAGEQRAGRRGVGGPHNAVADQPRQPAVRI
jgi:hypothetical protein